MSVYTVGFKYQSLTFVLIFPVLDLFLTRALAEHLPENLPVVPVAVNPGMCRSELAREFKVNFFTRMLLEFAWTTVGRTTEQGARQFLYAALGPDGKDGKQDDCKTRLFLRKGDALPFRK